MKRLHIALVLLLSTGLVACDNVLDTNPRASVPTEEAITTAKDAEAAVRGIYSALQDDDLYGEYGVIIPDLYADILEHTGTFDNLAELDNNAATTSNITMTTVWTDVYAGIGRANSVLAALPAVQGIDTDLQNQLRGEALFTRALMYFQLVNYFGGVPLVLEPTSSASNIAQPARATQDQVYAQIITDLTEAESLLPVFVDFGRANTYAAKALLARVYLYRNDWQKAAEKATEVIESGEYALVESFDRLLNTKNSSESILEIQFSVTDANSHAFWLFPSDYGGRREYAPTAALYAAYEEGDERRDATLATDDYGDLFGVKYFRIANGDDNVFALRLAEMYLIRAEARAHLGNLQGAKDDIDVVRERAGLGGTTASTLDEVIDAVLHERQVEFAMEGHRFFDLRRTGKAQQVLGIEDPNRLYFPIPQSERDVNPNLEQNAGY